MNSAGAPEAGARRPLVVGLGGAAREGSTTEMAMRVALEGAAAAGARTLCFGGDVLAALPMYRMDGGRSDEQVALLKAVRAADGLVIATPGYHGGVSGMVKNALDLLEDLRDDPRPYLHDRAVGCVVTGYGWQTCGSTLGALRAIVHALRGWPTPLGAALNVSGPVFDAAGACTDAKAREQLEAVGRQVAAFAQRSAPSPAPKAVEAG